VDCFRGMFAVGMLVKKESAAALERETSATEVVPTGGGRAVGNMGVIGVMGVMKPPGIDILTFFF
jgi:hypothetical protein